MEAHVLQCCALEGRHEVITMGKVSYWTMTGLLAALILMSAVPDVLRVPDAVAVMAHLGYPTYLLPFIGVAKILAILAVLVGGFPNLREWAYAGLTFDLLGALYSHLSVGDPASVWLFAALGLALTSGSYVLQRHRATGAERRGADEAGARVRSRRDGEAALRE